jgi:hypothetical protein
MRYSSAYIAGDTVSRLSARLSCRVGLSVLLLFSLSVAPYHSAAPESLAKSFASRQQLIGAWQLVSVHIIGPNGATIDPFYNAEPSGILVYDPSGWMSVQIAGQVRPSMETPNARSGGPHDPEIAQLEAAVLDTYYAYSATWEYDQATSTVTHHVKSSLYPGEVGMSYSQVVSLEGGKLIFTVRREAPGGETVQKKIWKRISRLDAH